MLRRGLAAGVLAAAILAGGAGPAGSRATLCSIDYFLPGLAIPQSCERYEKPDRGVKVKLRVNGEAFTRVAQGEKYTLSATLAGDVPFDASVTILERSGNQTTGDVVVVCKNVRVTRPCQVTVHKPTAGKFYVWALLDRSSPNLDVYAFSNEVTITVTEAVVVPKIATIEANGAIRGETLTSGTTTCTGSGYSQGTSCFVNVPIGSSVTLKGTLDAPLPADWSWELRWNGQSFPCPKGGETCTTSITETATGGIAQTYITTPQGWTGPALNTQPCQSGMPANGHSC